VSPIGPNAPIPQGPAIAPTVPWDIRLHLTQIYQKLGNHAQAFGIQQGKINALKSTTTTINQTISGGSSSGGGSVSSNVGLVNNQTGSTAYTTQPGDNGSILILSDASPIALTLASGGIPYFLIIANLGAGLATLTPAAPPSGTSTISYASNPAASSMPLPSGRFCAVGFDGNNWFGALDLFVLPQSFALTTHEFLNSYDASTGLFTAAQPDFTDISGQITTSQLPASGLSVTITTAALTGLGTQGSMTFTNGILTAQTPAT